MTWIKLYRRICTSRPAANESGQAMIELMLTMPILLLLLGGAVELARVAYAAITVTNAAQAAVAYGAQNSTTAKDATGMQLAASSDAINLPASANFATSTPVRSCVCNVTTKVGTVTTTTSTAMATCTSSCAGVTIQTLYLTTTASMTPMFNFPPFSGQTFNLTSTVSHEVLY